MSLNLYKYGTTTCVTARLKPKQQRINTVTFYLGDILVSLVGVVLEHIDKIQEPFYKS